jgi:hypothetical protein
VRDAANALRMDTNELALTPSMTLDFLPIRPMPNPRDKDITLEAAGYLFGLKSENGDEWA